MNGLTTGTLETRDSSSRTQKRSGPSLRRTVQFRANSISSFMGYLCYKLKMQAGRGSVSSSSCLLLSCLTSHGLCHSPFVSCVEADDEIIYECKANSHMMQDEDLRRVHELFAAVGKTEPPHTDISAMQWLREQVGKIHIDIRFTCIYPGKGRPSSDAYHLTGHRYFRLSCIKAHIPWGQDRSHGLELCRGNWDSIAQAAKDTFPFRRVFYCYSVRACFASLLANFTEALASLMIRSAKPSMCLQGASRRMMAIAEACYANDFGCSLDQLGLCEMITENQRWDSGDSPFTGCVLYQMTSSSSGCTILWHIFHARRIVIC